MKLLQWSNPWRRSVKSTICRVLSFSTTTSSKTLASSDSSNNLYRRISPFGDPRVSIVPILDKWVEEGRDIKQIEILRIIKQLRSYKRYNQALEMSEWMSYRRLLELSPGEIAIRLDLISKVRGIDEAEKYFNTIPDSLKAMQVYGALLSCYAHSKSLDKAEDLLQKMKKLGYVKTLSFNSMLKLYSQHKMYKKMETLIQEMKDKGEACDVYTLTTMLSAYADTSNIEEMEKFLTKMEVDPILNPNWHCYVVATNAYLKAGDLSKASTALKKSELLINGKSKKFAYEVILTLNSSLGFKDEVYRIWDLYKNLGRPNNSGYLCMISSLVKLDDLDGAEKIFKDWETGDTCFDSRVPNMMITTYCKKGFLEKAEAIINGLVGNGKELNASTWDRMAKGYYMNNRTVEAIEALKKAVSVGRPAIRWRPDRGTLVGCLEYLKKEGDIEGGEEFVRLFLEQDLVSVDIFNELIRFLNDKDRVSIVFDDQVGKGDKARDREMQERGEFENEHVQL